MAANILLLLFLLLLSISTSISTSTSTPKPLRRPMKEKLSHLHFYWHDVASGPSPTAVRVAQAPSTLKSATFFGAVVVIDDPLTVGPEPDSELLGRAQGLYVATGKEKVGFLMSMNMVFVGGKYNGSSITILGRNEVLTAVREMPVVGGSGLFRLARGYAQAKTYSFDTKTGDAVVEYNVHVLHY